MALRKAVPDEVLTGKKKKSKKKSAAHSSKPAHKRAHFQKNKKRKGNNSEVVTSGEESDRETALREVEAHEIAQCNGKHGLKNATLAHWHDPTPIQNSCADVRWRFKYRYCEA